MLEYVFRIDGKLPSKEVRHDLARDMSVVYGRLNVSSSKVAAMMNE